jgi:hypothetical protein
MLGLSLRTKRGQAHEEFSKLVDEERMFAGQLGAKRRELGTLRPAPVMEPPPHLAPLIERFRAQCVPFGEFPLGRRGFREWPLRLFSALHIPGRQIEISINTC